MLINFIYRNADLLMPTWKETSYSDRCFLVLYILFIIIIEGILVLFMYITRLAPKEIFSPSNKIHREVGRAKDLSTPLYTTRPNKAIILHCELMEGSGPHRF